MKSGLNLLKIIEEMRKFDAQIEAQAVAVFFFCWRLRRQRWNIYAKNK